MKPPWRPPPRWRIQHFAEPDVSQANVTTSLRACATLRRPRRHQDGRESPHGCRERSPGLHVVSAVAWWGHLVMLAGWSLLGLWATRNGKAFGPREVLHDDVTTARCDHRSGPNDRSMR
jgi:hypothetical protein